MVKLNINIKKHIIMLNDIHAHRWHSLFIKNIHWNFYNSCSSRMFYTAFKLLWKNNLTHHGLHGKIPWHCFGKSLPVKFPVEEKFMLVCRIIAGTESSSFLINLESSSTRPNVTRVTFCFMQSWGKKYDLETFNRFS